MEITWSKNAADDIKNIALYFIEIDGGLISEKNTIQVYFAIELIIKFPEVGKIINESKNIRELVVRNYNYTVPYRIDKDKNQIEILRIFDTRRNPTSPYI